VIRRGRTQQNSFGWTDDLTLDSNHFYTKTDQGWLVRIVFFFRSPACADHVFFQPKTIF
jgi:hypothetical protein